jgi:polyisoprenoid-binding protein YceI
MNKFLLASIMAAPFAFGSIYEVDTAHSNVGFEVTHLGITKVPGKFKDFKGNFEFDEKTQILKNLKVEIKTASVDTGNTDRDNHLKGPDFFNVTAKGNEVATFEIKGPVKVTGKALDGTLTLNQKTETIPMTIKFNGVAKMGETTKTAFDANTTIDRTKFGITWNKKIDAVQQPSALSKAANKAKDLAVGNEVALNINVEANKAEAKKLATE